jgi:hypothetical protein
MTEVMPRYESDKHGSRKMMTMEMQSMGVTMPEVAGHPNRTAFRGLLTVVDMPSQKAPLGAKGHLVVLTRAAADAALPSLIGMALDYAPTFDRHDVRRKVGVITRADIVGRRIELRGHLFAKDFPEIVTEIAKSGRNGEVSRSSSSSDMVSLGWPIRCGAKQSWQRGDGTEQSSWKSSLSTAAERVLSLTAAIRQVPKSLQGRGEGRSAHFCGSTSPAGGLGMSYEVTDVRLADANARVWTLTKVTFTGAAILRRDKAAYRDTWIELE